MVHAKRTWLSFEQLLAILRGPGSIITPALDQRSAPDTLAARS
jgi:hypothetical protein